MHQKSAKLPARPSAQPWLFRQLSVWHATCSSLAEPNVQQVMQFQTLLVSNSPDTGALMEQALKASGHQVVGRLAIASDLVAGIATARPDVLLIDCTVPADALLMRLRDILKDSPLPVVLFTQDDNPELIRQGVQAGVSAYVVNGLEPERLASILHVAVARFQETSRLQRELQETKASLAERKTVERAKGILMKQRGCDEARAYNALRKMAMDRNLNMAQAAEQVISVAELLR